MSVWVTEEPYEFHDIVVVIQRLSAAHYYYSGNLFPCDPGYGIYLVQHLRWQKTSYHTVNC